VFRLCHCVIEEETWRKIFGLENSPARAEVNWRKLEESDEMG
jgi:hypothetical protein